MPTFGDLLRATEAGGNDTYRTLFGYSQKDGKRFSGFDITKKTPRELMAFAARDGEYGKWTVGQLGYLATPMGAGQIVGDTMRHVVEAGHLDPDKPFDVAAQNRAITYLANTRNWRSEWEGFKDVGPEDMADAKRRWAAGETGLGGENLPEYNARPNSLRQFAQDRMNASEEALLLAAGGTDAAKGGEGGDTLGGAPPPSGGGGAPQAGTAPGAPPQGVAAQASEQLKKFEMPALYDLLSGSESSGSEYLDNFISTMGGNDKLTDLMTGGPIDDPAAVNTPMAKLPDMISDASTLDATSNDERAVMEGLYDTLQRGNTDRSSTNIVNYMTDEQAARALRYKQRQAALGFNTGSDMTVDGQLPETDPSKIYMDSGPEAEARAASANFVPDNPGAVRPSKPGEIDDSAIPPAGSPEDIALQSVDDETADQMGTEALDNSPLPEEQYRAQPDDSDALAAEKAAKRRKTGRAIYAISVGLGQLGRGEAVNMAEAGADWDTMFEDEGGSDNSILAQAMGEISPVAGILAAGGNIKEASTMYNQAIGRVEDTTEADRVWRRDRKAELGDKADDRNIENLQGGALFNASEVLSKQGPDAALAYLNELQQIGMPISPSLAKNFLDQIDSEKGTGAMKEIRNLVDIGRFATEADAANWFYRTGASLEEKTAAKFTQQEQDFGIQYETGLMDAADTATDNLLLLNDFDTVLDSIMTNPEATMGDFDRLAMTAGRMGAQLGFDSAVDFVEKWTGIGADQYEQMDAAGQELAFREAKAAFTKQGAVSDSERETHARTMPGLGKTITQNLKKTSTMRADQVADLVANDLWGDATAGSTDYSRAYGKRRDVNDTHRSVKRELRRYEQANAVVRLGMSGRSDIFSGDPTFQKYAKSVLGSVAMESEEAFREAMKPNLPKLTEREAKAVLGHTDLIGWFNKDTGEYVWDGE